MSAKKKCDYKCGRPAIHMFKNGMWCCSEYVVQCPSIRKKISEALKKNNKDVLVRKRKKLDDPSHRTIWDTDFIGEM